MTTFIKLTSTIINISHIQKITIKNDKYVLHLSDKNMNYCYLCPTKNRTQKDTNIEICKQKDLTDHTLMTNWIINLDKQRLK